MFTVRYNKLRLIPSKSAMSELMKLGLMLSDCKEILSQGFTARKRAKNTEEKWLSKGNKIINIVIVKTYNHFYNEDVYLITHIGKFTKK